MSVLVKGMEMPTSCDDCWFEYTYEICTPETGYENCPLIKLPSHGRLIDADYMKTKIEGPIEKIRLIHEWIDTQPTILEAEESEYDDK